jgi:alpha-1,6-mannosyltransferase
MIELSKTKAIRSTNKFLKRSNLLLIVLGCALFAVYLWSLRAHSSADIAWFLQLVLIASVLYLAGCWLVIRTQPSHATLPIVLIFAVLFRLSLLFAPPYLSDDIYRYIWDGRVQAAGINPYRYAPTDPALEHLRDDKIYPRINHNYAPTIYPPAAEAIWFATTRVSESVTWMKITMIAFEGIAIWALMQLLALIGLPRQRILLYSWHPLTVWEFAGSGHLDAIAIAFISIALLARYRKAQATAGLTLAGAALVKLFPAVLLPALYKRRDWKMPVVFALTIVLAYLPYLGVGARGVIGFLPGYARERGMFSGEQFFILEAIRRLPIGFRVPANAFIVFTLLILAMVALWILVRQKDDYDRYLTNTLLIACTFTVLLAPHFPWYFAWLVPFLCFVPSWPAIYLTLSSFLLYFTWIYWTADQVFTIKAAMFVPFFLLLGFSLWKRRAKLRIKVSPVEGILS